MTYRRSRTWLGVLAFGFAFLYAPILFLVAYSFNDSRIVTVWEKFSFRWYGELFQNEQILRAALTSFKIAAMSASMAVVLGTLAAFVSVRYRNFPGRTLLGGMVSAPLVMPDVIMGLALLFLFVMLERTFGIPMGGGIATVTLAHITLGMAYVAVVVKSRLLDFDMSLEEAALDLGARPLRVFFLITLPIISPSLIAGWLLAFTLSLDDVVIASFLSGPGSTTLPMVIFSSVRLGITPVVNALATIIILLVTFGVIVSGWIMHRGTYAHQKGRYKA